jgi:lysophospholipase L1-like esterase
MRTFVIAAFALCALAGLALAQETENSHTQWEKAISDFEAQDKEHPVAPGGILFLGSSSIRMWDLEKSFPGRPVLNRGFGGSQIADSLYFFDRVVLPYKPSTIVFYAGDNDIAREKSAEVVTADFKALTAKVWEHFPETRILFIGIKPSTARWNLYPEMKKVNEAIGQWAQAEKRVLLVDVENVMLGEDGLPRQELLQKDGLHMTEEGYAAWTKLLAPLLPAPTAG